MKVSGNLLFGLSLAMAFPSLARAYKCDSTHYPPPLNGDGTIDYTACMPPMLQVVEKDSFSFVFKVDDADVGVPISVVFYQDPHAGTYSPTACYQISSSSNNTYNKDLYDNYYTNTNVARYHEIKSSYFGVTLSPNIQYAYNVNVGGTCSNLTSGTWFDTRRYVTTAPTGRPSTIDFAIIGDTRDGGQGVCSNGIALQSYGDISAGSNCGGSNAQRAAFAAEVAAFTPALVLHTGDIGSSDKVSATTGYWQDIGYFWRDFSTTFMYGNHEFSSPGGDETGNQENFGTHNDTFVDDMIQIPALPAGYPATGASTYYAQNYANVHFIYLNSQLCVINGYHGSDSCPAGSTHKYESSGFNACSCYTYSTNQRNWLINDLRAANADPNIDFIVVGMHKPYWSNGADSYSSSGAHTGDSKDDEWTNTIAKKEYKNSAVSNNLSMLGGMAVASDGSSFADTGMIPLDAIFQMYNVDLFINSHAHYYEHLVDHRYRAATDPGLQHLIIGGGGSAEQSYQCPGGGVCVSATASTPHSYLPDGVTFMHAEDGNFYFGSGTVNNSSHTLQVYAVEVDDTNNAIAAIDSFPGSGIVSRKAQIRGTSGLPNHSGYTDAFNGCNLVYSSSTGLATNGTWLPPPTSHNINCTVN